MQIPRNSLPLLLSRALIIAREGAIRFLRSDRVIYGWTKKSGTRYEKMEIDKVNRRQARYTS